jgi:hypothetical protein
MVRARPYNRLINERVEKLVCIYWNYEVILHLRCWRHGRSRAGQAGQGDEGEGRDSEGEGEEGKETSTQADRFLINIFYSYLPT